MLLDDLGAFFELLVQAGRSLGTIKNYISAVKALYYERNVCAGYRFIPVGWVDGNG